MFVRVSSVVHVVPSFDPSSRKSFGSRSGASFADVVRTRVYLVKAEDFEGVGRAHGEIFGDVRPANTTLLAGGLLDPRWLVEIEAEAVVSGP